MKIDSFLVDKCCKEVAKSIKVSEKELKREAIFQVQKSMIDPTTLVKLSGQIVTNVTYNECMVAWIITIADFIIRDRGIPHPHKFINLYDKYRQNEKVYWILD